MAPFSDATQVPARCRLRALAGPTSQAAVLGVAAAALIGCAASAPADVPWKPAPVGASWGAQQRNTGSFGKDTQTQVTRVADMTWNGGPVMAVRTGAGGTLLQRHADGRWLAMLAPDGKPAVTFDPPAGWELPFEVGSRWRRQQKMTNVATGRTLEYEWACTVPAREKVTVPAGTFDAYRIECRTSIGGEDTYWVSPAVHPFLKTRSVRGPNHPMGAGTQETELLKLPG